MTKHLTAEPESSLARVRPSEVLPHQSKLYSHLSKLYDYLFPFIGGQLKKGLGMLTLPPKARVLEVGVGTGLSLHHYPKGCQIVGIDISGEMLERAKEKVERAGLTNVELRKTRGAELDFPENSFDCVAAFHVVSVVPDPVRLMREMERVCKPGGSLLLINYFCGETPFGEALGRLVDPLTRRLGWRSTLTATELLGDSSFHIEKQERTSWLSLHWIMLARNHKKAVAPVLAAE